WILLFPTLGAAQTAQPRLGTRAATVIEQNGLRFRDLNRNGKLDPYEDWRRSPDARARDLVSRMTLEEKAGTMIHGTARTGGPLGIAGMGASYAPTATLMLTVHANGTSMITRLVG